MLALYGVCGALAALAVGTLLFLQHRPPPGVAAANATASAAVPAALASLHYVPTPVGWPVEGHPIITHVALADLDRDGLLDILVCDGGANRVTWLRQFPRGTFTEAALGDPIPGPAHVAVCDFDGDGDPDLLVASMGQILPNNDRIGRVVLLENLGGGTFRNRIVAENIARVTDVRAADFNADGRLDLVVGQFGYDQGEIRWMENLGDGTFRSHLLLDLPGTIMTPVADFDGDGAPDFAALVSQDSEAVYLFANRARGRFDSRVLWHSANESWGSSGLEVADLNRDGQPDLVYSNGDGFDAGFGEPSPLHGLQWLENRRGEFICHRIGDAPGCYSPVVVDLNADGFPDIVTVSAFNHAIDTRAIWLTAWLNDGRQHFTPVALGREPTHLITVAAGDLDGNGVPVLVTGAFHAYPPYGRQSRLTLWRRQ